MQTRRRMPLGRGLAAGLLAVASACNGAAPDARPDVILVSIDSLRPDHLGCYGYPHPTSPTIDRIAREGVLFENAVSTTSWTLPAHAALFTGLYDATHGVVTHGLRLAGAHTTLAESLRAAGYETAGFFGGPYLHPTFGLDQGFDTWQSCMTRIADGASDLEVERQAWRSESDAHADVTGPLTVERVAEWLERERTGPFFLFIHLWDVHYDYIPPGDYVEIFDPDYEGDLTGEDFAANPRITADLPERDRRHLVALYDAEIRFTDDVLKRLLAVLARRGRLDDSILAITADHGEEFFEHGGSGHRRTLYDEVLRVPLILRWPAGEIRGGRRIPDQVRLIDLMPTLLALVGEPPPDGLQGRDLGPLLRGEAMEPSVALGDLRVAKKHLRALRTATHKVIAWSPNRFSYYDLAVDPGEMRALRGARAGFHENVERLRRETRAALAHRDRLGDLRSEPSELSKAMQEQLRALGYLSETP